jgi:hypothetical protein
MEWLIYQAKPPREVAPNGWAEGSTWETQDGVGSDGRLEGMELFPLRSSGWTARDKYSVVRSSGACLQVSEVQQEPHPRIVGALNGPRISAV